MASTSSNARIEIGGPAEPGKSGPAASRQAAKANGRPVLFELNCPALDRGAVEADAFHARRSPGAFADNFYVSAWPRYHGAVFGNVGRKLVEGAVGLFAVLGFVYVPLGRQTGFEHARAVLTTPAALSAIDDLTSVVLGLRQRALDLVLGRAPSRAHEEKHRRAAEEPRPIPPKLK